MICSAPLVPRAREAARTPAGTPTHHAREIGRKEWPSPDLPPDHGPGLRRKQPVDLESFTPSASHDPENLTAGKRFLLRGGKPANRGIHVPPGQAIGRGGREQEDWPNAVKLVRAGAVGGGAEDGDGGVEQPDLGFKVRCGEALPGDRDQLAGSGDHSERHQQVRRRTGLFPQNSRHDDKTDQRYAEHRPQEVADRPAHHPPHFQAAERIPEREAGANRQRDGDQDEAERRGELGQPTALGRVAPRRQYQCQRWRKGREREPLREAMRSFESQRQSSRRERESPEDQ